MHSRVSYVQYSKYADCEYTQYGEYAQYADLGVGDGWQGLLYAAHGGRHGEQCGDPQRHPCRHSLCGEHLN